MNLKTILTLLFSSAMLLSLAQERTKGELKKHSKAIEESRKNGSLVASLDTIYDRGVAVMIMLFDQSKFNPENFTIKAFGNDEVLITVRDYTSNYVEYNFPTLDNRRAYIKHNTKFQDIAQTIMNNGLLTNQGLNVENAEKFITTYAYAEKSSLTRSMDHFFYALNYQGSDMVKRRRDVKVVLVDNQIYQDNLLVGKFHEKQDVFKDEVSRIISVHYMSGDLCVQIIFPLNDPKKAKILSMKDGSITELTVESDQEAFQFLTDRYYL